MAKIYQRPKRVNPAPPALKEEERIVTQNVKAKLIAASNHKATSAKGNQASDGIAETRAATQPKTEPLTCATEKGKRPKLIRDGFTMPEAEYQVLGDVKKACLKAGIAVKKSELLRVGVVLIRDLNIADLKKAIAGLAPLKAGRPKNEK